MRMYRVEMFDVLNGDHFFLEIEAHSNSLAYLKAGQEWPSCTVVTCKLKEALK